jgi:hypothetical protein
MNGEIAGSHSFVLACYFRITYCRGRLKVEANSNGIVERDRSMSVAHLEYAGTNLSKFVATRVGLPHLHSAALISHLKAACLLFFSHFLPR